MVQRFTCIAVAGVIALSQTADAQAGATTAAASVSLHGVAYDSLRGEPLHDAFIAIVGRAQSTTTDSRGRLATVPVFAGVVLLARRLLGPA